MAYKQFVSLFIEMNSSFFLSTSSFISLLEILEQHAAAHHLGALLVEHHALIDLVDGCGAYLVGIHHDDGDAHDVDALELAGTIARLDESVLQVLLGVEIGDARIEVCDDAVANLLHDVEVLEDHDEVIASHMAHEVGFGTTFAHRSRERMRQEKQHLVALVETVVFVVFLEVVEVDVHHGKVLFGSLAVAYLPTDDVVARQARQRIQVAV